MVDRTHDRILRLPELLSQVGMSRATIYRRIKAKRFPKPEQLSDNVVGWWSTDVTRWKAAPMQWTPDG